MLLVDNQAGSVDLIKPLTAAGLPVEETRLEAGDLLFEGRGIKGKPVTVGIEYKKLNDLITSIRTERLQGLQLPKMRKAEYDYIYLYVEGELLFDTQGLLLRRVGRKDFRPLKGAMGIGELFKRLNTLSICAGVRVVWGESQRHNVKSIEALYRWWTDTDLDKHNSHVATYDAPAITEVSEERALLMKLPGIGFAASNAAITHFGSVFRAMTASAEEWAEIETMDTSFKKRRLGLSTGQKIVKFVRGE